MAISALAAELIGVGAQQGMNIGNQLLQRHWAIKDYQRQRRDNLADFNMANAYNSPDQQMARLRQAGLNPNLVYGKGADMAAVQLRGADLETPKNMAPVSHPNILGAMQVQSSLRQQQAQTDNVIQDTKNKEIAARLAELEVLNKNIKNSADELQLRQNKELYDDYLQKFRLENKLISQKIDLDLNASQREDLNASQNRAESIQRVAESKKRELMIASQISNNNKQRELYSAQIRQIDAVIKLTNNQSALAAADLKLRKWGVTPNDPWYIRALAALGKNPNAEKTEVEREINRNATYEEQSDNKYGHGAIIHVPLIGERANDWLNTSDYDNR